MYSFIYSFIHSFIVGVETDVQTLQSIQSQRFGLNLANAQDTLAANCYKWRDAVYTRRAFFHAGHQAFHLLWAFLSYM